VKPTGGGSKKHRRKVLRGCRGKEKKKKRLKEGHEEKRIWRSHKCHLQPLRSREKFKGKFPIRARFGRGREEKRINSGSKRNKTHKNFNEKKGDGNMGKTKVVASQEVHK